MTITDVVILYQKHWWEPITKYIFWHLSTNTKANQEVKRIPTKKKKRVRQIYTLRHAIQSQTFHVDKAYTLNIFSCLTECHFTFLN